MFKGAITALITPFINGKIDEKAYQSFIEWQIEQGIDGLVPCGTTGESPTLSHTDHNRVIDLCVEVAKGKVPVMAGAGSNSTSEAIMLAKHAKKVGTDSILVATPYYNKPNQEGLYQHYKAIHDAVDIPLVMYNIPGRSVVDMSDETISRLAHLDNVIGLKDATGDLSRTGSLRLLLEDKENFCLLSGDDATAVAFNAQGGNGCISVTSNIAPKQVAAVQKATLSGDYKTALELHEKLLPLHFAMFCDTSPGPAKHAASMLGICGTDMNLPLTNPSDENKKLVEDAMRAVGIV